MMKTTYWLWRLLFGTWLLSSCAQQVPPTGGPKDITPPMLVGVTPKNQSTNFSGRRLELEFDEYVSVDNINQQLLITPALPGNYSVKIRPKGVGITLDSALRPNTTYSFNFRNTFKDVTERNPARNVKLVFSTGPAIDSVRLSGQVKNLLTNQPTLEALVGLYPISDTLQFNKNKPYYFTRTDSAGNYALENLQAGTYRLAAITDGNNNLLYDPQKERIGFEVAPLKLTANESNHTLSLVMADRSLNRVLSTRPSVNYYTIVYNKGIKQAIVHFATPADSLPYLMLDEKQLRFFNTNNAIDTLRTTIEVTDSLDQVFRYDQKIKFRPKGKKEEGVRETFETRIIPADREEADLPFVYKLRFNKPIRSYLLSEIQIHGDTINRAILTEKNLHWNEYRNELTIETPVQAQRDVRVTIPKGTFISVEQDSNQIIRMTFPLRNADNYGVISGAIQGATEGILVELLNAEYKVISSQRDRSKYEFRSVKPGIYFVRMIQDRNHNGRWDPGDPSKFIAPEPVRFYSEKITVRPLFEYTDIDIPIN